MKQKEIIVAIVIAVIVIVIGAALLLSLPPAEQYTCPDGTVVSSPEQCPGGVAGNPPMPAGEGEDAGQPSLPF